jgi:hypothetical protein
MGAGVIEDESLRNVSNLVLQGFGEVRRIHSPVPQLLQLSDLALDQITL